MKLKYVGPLGGQIVVAAKGRDWVTDVEGTIEVPEDIGTSLLEQSGNWAEPSIPQPQEID